MGNTPSKRPMITSSAAYMPEDNYGYTASAPLYGPGYTAQEQRGHHWLDFRHIYGSTGNFGGYATSGYHEPTLSPQQQQLLYQQQVSWMQQNALMQAHNMQMAQLNAGNPGGAGPFGGGGGGNTISVTGGAGGSGAGYVQFVYATGDHAMNAATSQIGGIHDFAPRGLAIADAQVAQLRAAASADLDTVTELTSDIVDNYGAAEMQRSAQISDKLLALVGQDGGGEFSDKLGNLILTAKGLDPAEATKQRSIWRRFLNFLGIKAETAAAQYKMLDAQLGTLVSELGVHSKRQVARKQDMESLYQENTRSYNEIESLVKKGRAFLEKQKATPVKEVATGMEAQQIADMQALQQRLDKRITDLDVARTLMLQTAPEIRIMQASAQALIDKFTTLVNLTIPAWKKQFALHVLQLEQKRSAIVADAVDDATNDAFVKNASMLHDNTVQVAAAGQRQLMDMATVEHVQGEILRTVNDVRQINAEASANRAQIAGKLGVIRNDLLRSVAGQHVQLEAPKAGIALPDHDEAVEKMWRNFPAQGEKKEQTK